MTVHDRNSANNTSVRYERRALPFGRRAVIGALLVSLAPAVAVAFLIRELRESAPAPAGQTIEITMTRPVLVETENGIDVTVPAGTAEASAASIHGFSLPPVIRLKMGQTLSVRNEDSVTHVILGLRVLSGQSAARTLEQSGYEVYSAGCAAHATAPEMTTLIVSPAGEGVD
jgi:hypothetical protein